MNEQDQVLIELLADTDALFKPYRHRGSLRTGAVYSERRNAYHEAGLLWASEEPTDAGRKASQRELELCVKRKLVKAVKSQGRTSAVSLTNEGEQYARALAGNPGIAEAIPILERMIELQSEAEKYYLPEFQLWVPETRLIELDWGDGDYLGELSLLQFMLAPALHRGWVHFKASWKGHGWYHPNCCKPWLLAETIEHLPEYDPEAATLYDRRVQSAASRLLNAEPEDKNSIGLLPCTLSFALAGYPGKIHVHGEGSPEVLDA
jgi:hypothetical protein